MEQLRERSNSFYSSQAKREWAVTSVALSAADKIHDWTDAVHCQNQFSTWGLAQDKKKI